MTSINWQNYLDKGIEAVKTAGLLLHDFLLLKVELKPDGSPVSNADKAVEQAIRNLIIPQFPDCGFEGEEFETINPNAALRWLCDPIDGTWSFLNKEVTAAITLSLFAEGQPKVAIIYNPFTEELYAGCEGRPVLLNQLSLPRMTRENLAESLINFHISPSKSDLILQIYNWWEQERFAKVVSQGGSVAYGMAKVAEGIHSVYIGFNNKKSNLWDLGAGIFLIRSIGGKVTDQFGNDLYQCEADQMIIASAQADIHAEMMELLREVV